MFDLWRIDNNVSSPTTDNCKPTTPSLIVTVDTEEEGLWGGQYRKSGNTVENIQGVPRFQELCDRFGVRPTYLVDAPVVEDDRAVALLRAIQDDGRAEIGAHLHPWCNPPYGEELNARNSYMCNLPESLQREKLIWITEQIEERFGRRPSSFRAGRYGLDIVGARILHDLCYLVDSSVIPFTDCSKDGGPDFRDAPWQPYYVDGKELCEAGVSGQRSAVSTQRSAVSGQRSGGGSPRLTNNNCQLATSESSLTPDTCHLTPESSQSALLEVPVSVGFSRPNFARAQAILRVASRPWLRRLRIGGVVDRLGIARRIKFSPEQADARRMRQLVDAFLAQGAPAVVMMLHSSSLLPGLSPYVRSEQDLQRIYGELERTFHYCLERGMIASAVTMFACQFREARTFMAPSATSAEGTLERSPGH